MRPWPCLCGQQPEVEKEGWTLWTVSCSNCSCIGGVGESEKEAVASWNEHVKTECPRCAGPTRHEGDPRCPQRKSLASGGHVAHCTCDTCF